MASQNKKKKLKNSYGVGSILKNKIDKGPKRAMFFTPSQRKENNNINLKNRDYE